MDYKFKLNKIIKTAINLECHLRSSLNILISFCTAQSVSNLALHFEDNFTAYNAFLIENYIMSFRQYNYFIKTRQNIFLKCTKLINW